METPARTAEDIIGIVPHTLGYIPRDSLVAVIVGTEADGTQSCATTVRTDFTLETAARIVAEGGRWYADMITRACAVSGVFLLLYDDDYAGDDSTGTDSDGTDSTGRSRGRCGRVPPSAQGTDQGGHR